MPKFVKVVFAQDGDLVPVPDDAQLNNSVSYTDGYTINYSEDPDTVPGAFYFPREQHNQILNDLSGAIQQFQISNVPSFITTSDNGGSPYPYDIPATVLYDDGVNGPRAYQNLVNGNIVLPTDQTKWQILNGDSFVVAGGSANAITLAPRVPYLYYNPGTYIEFLATNTNTAATTVTISGLGTINLKVTTPYGPQDLSALMIVAGNIYRIVYDGTNFQLLNPSVSDVQYAIVSFTTPQNIPEDGSSNVVAYDTVVFDPNGWFDPVTFKFLPNISGLFSINVTQFFANFSDASNANFSVSPRRNGVSPQTVGQGVSIFQATVSRTEATSGFTRFRLNGTTDYVEILASCTSGTGLGTVDTTGQCFITFVGG